MPIELKAFLAISPGHGSLAVRDDAQGNPKLVGTGLQGRVFRVLDRVPLVRYLPPIARYRDDNIRAYALLRTALVKRYGVDNAVHVLDRKLQIRPDAALDKQKIDAVKKILDEQKAEQFLRAFLQLRSLENRYGQGAMAGMRDYFFNNLDRPITNEQIEQMPAEAKRRYDLLNALRQQDKQAVLTPPPPSAPKPAAAARPPAASSLPSTSSPPPAVEASELTSSDDDLSVTAFHTDGVLGLPNLGSTCYANAGLKFVLYAFGLEAITSPVASDYSSNHAASSRHAIAGFMQAFAARVDKIHEQLSMLFSELKNAPEFQMFRNTGPYAQHDATNFVEGVVRSLKLDSLASHKIQLCRSTALLQPMETHGEPTCMINLGLDGKDKNLDLQQILNRKLLATGDAIAESSQYPIQGLAVDDIIPLQGFVLRVTYSDGALGTADSQSATSIQYDKAVKLPITDLGVDSGETLVTLAPVAVVMHRGTANGGHYYMYCKTAAGWQRHDDGAVTPVREVPSNERPVLIGLRVVEWRWMEGTFEPQTVDSADVER